MNNTTNYIPPITPTRSTTQQPQPQLIPQQQHSSMSYSGFSSLQNTPNVKATTNGNIYTTPSRSNINKSTGNTVVVGNTSANNNLNNNPSDKSSIHMKMHRSGSINMIISPNHPK